jgi:phosphatidate cytidylyltransferase
VLRQRSISAVGVVLFAAVPAFLGSWVFLVALLILAVAGCYELLRALSVPASDPTALLTYLGAAALVIAAGTAGPHGALAAIVVLYVILALSVGVARAAVAGGLRLWTAGVLAVVYLGLPLAYAVALRNLHGSSTQPWVVHVSDWLASGRSLGLAWVGVVFAVTWLNDTAAYLVGRAFGKTKLVPELSPGKTRVGAVAGLVAGILTGMLAAWVFGAPVTPAVAAGLGFCLALAGQFGDLGESLIKRNLEIKDMGSLIPGHGGVLDRIDALLFTFPLMYLLARLLERVGWA